MFIEIWKLGKLLDWFSHLLLLLYVSNRQRLFLKLTFIGLHLFFESSLIRMTLSYLFIMTIFVIKRSFGNILWIQLNWCNLERRFNVLMYWHLPNFWSKFVKLGKGYLSFIIASFNFRYSMAISTTVFLKNCRKPVRCWALNNILM